MLSPNADSCGSDGCMDQVVGDGGARLESPTLRDAAKAQVSSSPIPVGTTSRSVEGDAAALFSSARCGQADSTTSNSLDAVDEADAGPPADTAELASTPSSAPVYPPHHRWLVESRGGDSPMRRLEPSHDETGEQVTHDARMAPPRSPSHEEHQKNPVATLSSPATPTHPTSLLRRRSAKRTAQPTLLQPREATGSSGPSPTSSPLAPRSLRVSLSQPPSTLALSAVGEEGAQRGCAVADAPLTSPLLPTARRGSGDEGKPGLRRDPSPSASPPLLTAAAAALDFSDGSPELRSSDAFRSPLITHLRLAPRSNAELQQFGCCVFFFPAPLVSWMFPLIGHVAISNAEGSRLFTFESSYYVREEKLAMVLDRVLREEMSNGCLSPSPSRRGRAGLEPPTQRADTSERAHTPSPAQSPLPFRGAAVSDASTSDVGLNSPSDCSAASPAQYGASTPLFPPRSSARPPRRTGRSRPSGAASTSGHTHTRCVRIWDLKPLLMESRGHRTRRAPYGITRESGRQAAVALWERLQGLLQPTEDASANGGGGGASATSRAAGSAASRRCASDGRGLGSATDGTFSAAKGGCGGSSSSDEDDEYELLDTETAHFYNRNLNATIRLFRGSADGSNNSPDVVLQHHSSFSFVGFVLEACGIGSQAKPMASPAGAASPATGERDAGPPSSQNGANTKPSSASAAASSADGGDAYEEIHWGAVKLLFHVCVFGKWHRGEGRLRRALHGGSITSAAILWIVFFAICCHYFRVVFLL